MKLVATINASTKKAEVTIDNEAMVLCPIVKQSNGSFCINVSKTSWIRQWISIPESKTTGIIDMTFEKDSDEVKAYTKGTSNSGKIWNATIEQRLDWFNDYAKENGYDVEDLISQLKEDAKERIEQEKKSKELSKLEEQAKKIQEQIENLRKMSN